MAGSLGASTLNLAILTGVLAYYLKDPLKQYVANRRTFLRSEVDAVAEQLRASRTKYDEFSARMQALEQEVQTLHAQILDDAKQSQTRIQTEAQRLAEELVRDAKNASSGSFTDFQHQLRVELAEKILDRVELILKERLTGEEKVRIRRDFSKQVETSV